MLRIHCAPMKKSHSKTRRTATMSSSKHGYTFLEDGQPSGVFRPAPKTLSLVVAGDPRMHINSKGRVGINTNAPQARLHVSGDILCSDAHQIRGAAAATAGNPSFSWENDADTGLYLPEQDAVGVATAGVERVRVAADGNVGVNVATPAERLDVDGAVQVSGQVKGAAVGDAVAPSFTWTGDADTGVFRGAPDTVCVSTGGTERMRVTDTGRLGLNTTDPQETLHVDGTVRAPVVLSGKIVLTPAVQ